MIVRQHFVGGQHRHLRVRSAQRTQKVKRQRLEIVGPLIRFDEEDRLPGKRLHRERNKQRLRGIGQAGQHHFAPVRLGRCAASQTIKTLFNGLLASHAGKQLAYQGQDHDGIFKMLSMIAEVE